MKQKIKSSFRPVPLEIIALAALIVIGGLLRFYDLNWGAPFYFHPDERNIASSISQLSFPENLNPNFFAYGSLPIYSAFLWGFIVNLISKCELSAQNCAVSFEQAIFYLRFFSATLSTILVLIVYKLGTKIADKKTALFAAGLTTFSTGLLQYSHFGTYEIWTTTFSALLLLSSINYLETKSKKYFYVNALLSGILVSLKISNLVFLAIPAAAIILNGRDPHRKKLSTVIRIFVLLIFLITYTAAIFFLTNPFALIDNKSFIGSMNYESSVATGSMFVFYTGEFFGSIPGYFQVTKILPFLLNPVVLVLSFFSFFYLIYQALWIKDRAKTLLLITILIIFFSQIFLFVKWARYMVPLLPFVYLMISCAIFSLIKSYKYSKYLKPTGYLLAFASILSSVIFSLSYLKTTFYDEDTRLQAKNFAVERIPEDALIISEVYDLGITPFNESFHNIRLFNFYDLDIENPNPDLDLNESLRSSEYLIIPSQRILATRSQNKNNFPKGNKFYTSELNNPAKFSLVYTTSCDIFCKITYLTDPINRFEGTVNVFDRPHVQIFKIHAEN